MLILTPNTRKTCNRSFEAGLTHTNFPFSYNAYYQWVRGYLKLKVGVFIAIRTSAVAPQEAV